MSLFREATHRDLVLYVNGIRPSTIEAIETYKSRYEKEIQILILVDSKKKKLAEEARVLSKRKKITVVYCDTDVPVQIKKTLAPYKDRLLAVSSQFESFIPTLKKILPHVPYLNGPTEESLDWSTDKLLMRRMLHAHDPKITPKYTVIEDISEKSLAKVTRKVGYPLIVKPTGLAGSLLVSVAYHEEELIETLNTIFKKINKQYKKDLGRGNPTILIEKLMEGTMYSIDSYVNDRGNVYHTPPVHVKTGKAIGFDDYFGYQQLTPTKLIKPKVDDANHVVAEAIKALGLRSTTVHTELMRTDGKWKIIELGPRVGGYRHTMYNWSFGINHILNDLLIRIPQKPVIPKKRKGFTVAFKIYAKKEGRLNTIKGLRKVRELDSFVFMNVHKKKGDQLLFAKNGGRMVLEVILFNKKRSDLLADIRRMEKSVDIVVNPKRHIKPH